MNHATRRPRVLPILTALALLAPSAVHAAPARLVARHGAVAPVAFGLVSLAPAEDAKALAAFEAGFNEGQAKFDRGENLEAARAWIAAASNLKETTTNRDNRIAVYEYVVDAFTRGLAGEKRPEALREAVTALDAYCDGFTRAYGTETPLSPKISAARDDFRKRLEAAEAAPPEDTGGSDVGPGPEGPDEGDLPPPVEPDRPTGKPWLGLAIGGGVLIGLGIGGAVLAGVGGARGKKADQEFDDPANMCSLTMPSPSCQSILDRGNGANAMTIAGAVLAPLFIGAGVGLLAVGLKRRAQPATALVPRVGPNFVGLSLRGSF